MVTKRNENNGIPRPLSHDMLVNGFLTKKIYLERGVRQGDPLSLYQFLVAVEAFVSALQTSANIEGISIPVRHTITCLSYADDVTRTLMGHTSVQQTFSLLSYFEKASALKTWKKHTVFTVLDFLPQINFQALLGQTNTYVYLESSLASHQALVANGTKFSAISKRQ